MKGGHAPKLLGHCLHNHPQPTETHKTQLLVEVKGHVYELFSQTSVNAAGPA